MRNQASANGLKIVEKAIGGNLLHYTTDVITINTNYSEKVRNYAIALGIAMKQKGYKNPTYVDSLGRGYETLLSGREKIQKLALEILIPHMNLMVCPYRDVKEQAKYFNVPISLMYARLGFIYFSEE